jgi:Skp family chaperone for outer membrane proteins
MKKVILFLSLILILCCKSSQEGIYKGDIYIKLINFGSMYGASKEKVYELKEQLKGSDTLIKNESDKIFVRYFKNLEKHNLLEKPYFKLKLPHGEIINVYTEEEEYLKLEVLLKGMDRDKEKIEVEFQGDKKEEGIFYASKLLTINKVAGKTDWKK